MSSMVGLVRVGGEEMGSDMLVILRDWQRRGLYICWMGCGGEMKVVIIELPGWQVVSGGDGWSSSEIIWLN